MNALAKIEYDQEEKEGCLLFILIDCILREGVTSQTERVDADVLMDILRHLTFPGFREMQILADNSLLTGESVRTFSSAGSATSDSDSSTNTTGSTTLEPEGILHEFTSTEHLEGIRLSKAVERRIQTQKC